MVTRINASRSQLCRHARHLCDRIAEISKILYAKNNRSELTATNPCFRQRTVIDGKDVRLDYAKINGDVFRNPRLVRVISLEDDWCEDIDAPAAVIAALNNTDIRADIFLLQRLPDLQPKYSYTMELDSIAFQSNSFLNKSPTFTQKSLQ